MKLVSRLESQSEIIPFGGSHAVSLEMAESFEAMNAHLTVLDEEEAMFSEGGRRNWTTAKNILETVATNKGMDQGSL